MNEMTNSPRLVNPDGDLTIRRYTHSAVKIVHQGITVQIQPNGKVILTKPTGKGEEYDEIEAPASLFFKVAGYLRDTRNVEYIQVEKP